MIGPPRCDHRESYGDRLYWLRPPSFAARTEIDFVCCDQRALQRVILGSIVRVRERVRVRVRVRVCVRVRVRVRERERERERERVYKRVRERERVCLRERERERERVCVRERVRVRLGLVRSTRFAARCTGLDLAWCDQRAVQHVILGSTWLGVINMCVCVYTCVCVCACVYGCMCVCVCVCVCVCLCVLLSRAVDMRPSRNEVIALGSTQNLCLSRAAL